MPFITQGKTNWKFLVIVIILAIIVGGGALWFSVKQKVPPAELPELKKPAEITEETCEELSGKDKDECYFELAKKSKSLEFCEKIESYVIISECKTEIKTLKFIEKGQIPSNIVNSDKELKEYLVKNLIATTDIDGEFGDLSDSCSTHFIRGNFDGDSLREIVVAFECGPGSAGSGIIQEKEDGFYLTYWDASGWRIYDVKLYDLQMVKNQPRFVIKETTSHPGTGMSYGSISISKIEKSEGLFENEFKTLWSGETTSVDDQPWTYRYYTEINTEFKDLDGDGNLEIIREGYKKTEEGFNEETGEFEHIKEGKIYQVLKWHEQTQSFIDETADWKTYRNEEYGFEIKYPEDWKIETKEKGEQSLGMGYWSLFGLSLDKEGLPYLTLIVEDKNFVLGTRDWKDFKLGQIDGSISYTFKADKLAFSEIIFTSNNGQIFYITTENDPLKDEFTNQMLSTFRFIEPEETTCEQWRKECAAEGENLCGPCGCKSCCSGLVKRDVTYPYKDKNNKVFCLEEMTAYTCVKCGDKICDKGEDWCICSEDCTKPNPEDLQMFIMPE